MTIRDDTHIEEAAGETAAQDDERLWKTAEAAFLDRYTRSTELLPEKVAKWAVEGAVALGKEFTERKGR